MAAGERGADQLDQVGVPCGWGDARACGRDGGRFDLGGAIGGDGAVVEDLVAVFGVGRGTGDHGAGDGGLSLEPDELAGVEGPLRCRCGRLIGRLGGPGQLREERGSLGVDVGQRGLVGADRLHQPLDGFEVAVALVVRDAADRGVRPAVADGLGLFEPVPCRRWQGGGVGDL